MATIPDMVKKDGTVAESELKAAGFMPELTLFRGTVT